MQGPGLNPQYQNRAKQKLKTATIMKHRHCNLISYELNICLLPFSNYFIVAIQYFFFASSYIAKTLAIKGLLKSEHR
jgi:hypothetical protein